VNAGIIMGPVYMLNGSVVVMLVRLPKDNSNAPLWKFCLLDTISLVLT
jgi:predicted membrane protein